MKTEKLKTERKYFPTFELKLSAGAAIKFAVESLSLTLMASVDEFGFALVLGLFCGFVYARQNILALAPAFIISVAVFAMNWWSLLFATTPILMLFLLYVLFFKLRRNVPLWGVALAAVVGMLPYIVVNAVVYTAYIHVAIAVLIAIVAVFVAGIACYAVLVRGTAGYVCVEELIALGVMAAAFGYALSGADLWGFKLVYVAAGATILLSSQCFKPHITLFTALLLGIGVALDTGDLACLAGLAVVAVAAVAFSPFTKWSSALGMLAAQGVMWLTDAYMGADWRTLVMTAVGAAACLAIPRGILSCIRALSSADNRTSYAAVVNRQARNMASRLYHVSDVFYELSKGLEKTADANSVYSADRLAHEVARGYCGKCPDRNGCFKPLGGEDTYPVIKPMAEAALNRGKVTILDMPPFITSRCAKMHTLASVINGTAESYIQKREACDSAMLGKRMLSEQFAGVALLLDALAEDCASPVSFAGDDVELLKSELLKHNVVASEAVITGMGDDMRVTLLVRAQDASKTALVKIAAKVLRRRFALTNVFDRGEDKLVLLEAAPTFEIAYGIAQRCVSEQGVCGDSKSVLCPSLKLRSFAICDGMGNGEEAAKASRNAVNMIESFYRAGFDGGTILSLVNKLLGLSLEDSFSSLDIAVIDASNGGLDVIKLGAASSFIVRKDGIEQISCEQPPVGILDKIRPVTSRYQLFDGDILIMMSDGVFDFLETKGVADILESANTTNPQTIADKMLAAAVKNGSKDDCTVLAMRLFAV